MKVEYVYDSSTGEGRYEISDSEHFDRRVKEMIEEHNKKASERMKAISKPVEICEELGWLVRVREDGSVILENWSPAGEDLIIEVAPYELIETVVRKTADVFDPDEHAEMWLPSRGENGVPYSIRTLIEDADEIENMYEELAAALEE